MTDVSAAVPASAVPAAPSAPSAPSARRAELLELAYGYLLARGRAELSLRPLATAIGSSPRVLLYLFGSKDGLIRALLARAREAELALLNQASTAPHPADPPVDGPAASEGPAVDGGVDGGALASYGADGLGAAGARIWAWLSAETHRGLLGLWVDGYARSLTDPAGPWADFAAATVTDWLAVLAAAQPAGHRGTAAGQAERTLLLAVLRGALLDLLATGDLPRTTAGVTRHLATLTPAAGLRPA
jgi:AcrR family transcriptional regulator